MSWFDGLRHRLRVLLRPDVHANEVLEEFRFHQDLAQMQSADARSNALRFGNQTWYREEVRRMSWIRFVDVARQDVGYAVRSMRRNIGVTVTIVLTLALGIGINSSAFAVLDVLFFRAPSGIPEPDKVKRFYAEHFVTIDGKPFTAQNLTWWQYEEFAKAVGDSSRSAVYIVSNSLRMGRHPRDPQVRGVYASASYFGVLGVRAHLGRFFTAEEDRLGAGVPVVVLSHGFWQRHFSSDSNVVGRVIPIGSTQYEIIGVLDAEFSGIDIQANDVWIPISTLPPNAFGPGPWWEKGNSFAYQAIFWTDEPIQEHEIVQRATALFRAHERQSTDKQRDTLLTVYSGSIIEAQGPAKADDEHIISTRLAVVSALVMLIVFANVVNLLLARAVRRRQEFAIRLSLGISRGRMLRMLVIESVALALLAVVPAVAAAWWGGTFLRTLLMPDVEWFSGVVTVRVVVFAFVLALAAGVLAGLVPAFQSAQPQVAHFLKGSTRTGQRQRSLLRNGLLAAQAALSVVLLVGAVLFVRSLTNVQRVDIGYEASRLVFGRMAFAQGESPPRPVLNAGLRDVVARLESRSSVEEVSMASQEPMRGMSGMRVQVSDDTAGIGTAILVVSENFFRTVGMTLLAGSPFRPGELEVVVNRIFANRAWPGENPVGRYFHRGDPEELFEIVGVVPDVHSEDLASDPGPIAYAAYWVPGGGPVWTITVRTVADPEPAIALLREAVRSLDPDIPVANIRTMEQIDRAALAERRFQLALIATQVAALNEGLENLAPLEAELNQLKQQLATQQQSLAGLNEQLSSQDVGEDVAALRRQVEERMSSVAEEIRSIDSFRLQTNRALTRLQTQLRSLDGTAGQP